MSEFGTLNLEDLALEEQRLGADNNNKGGKRDDLFVRIPKPKPGGTTVFPVRVLPPVKGQKLFQYTRLHMVKGNSGKVNTVHCPKELVIGKNGGPVWDRNTYCPVCEYYNSLWRRVEKLEDLGKKAEAEKIKKEARSIKPIERYYYNAIVRQEKDDKGEIHYNVGPKVLSVGKVLHTMIMWAIKGNKAAQIKAIGDITDIKTGSDFTIRMMISQGDDEFPNYDKSDFERDTSPAGKPEEVKKWAQGLHDLTALRKPATADELDCQLARHRGLIDDEDQGFNVEAFDAKYRQAESPVTHVSMNGTDLPVDVDTDTEETTPVAPAEDTTLTDDEFLEELQSMAEDE